MAVQVRDEDNNAVDWWFLYKVPKLQESTRSDSATGYEYVYFDPTQKSVTRSKYTLDQGKGALSNTLATAFGSKTKSTGWLLYNDEKPAQAGGRDDGNCGHTKGVLAYDTETKKAFWLIHSWPKYAAPDETAWPTPMYGQTYLCLSLSLDTATAIAKQMFTDHEPQSFLPHDASPVADPIFAKLEKVDDSARDPHASTTDHKTDGGMPFKVLSKNREWNGDFWNGWVGPQLKADLDVDTWIRGTIPPVADTDGIHKTFDIKYINLGPLGIHYAWPETHDHAKWAITKDHNWVCVGDINRMISQRKRGGGAVAFQNPTLWTALSHTDLLLAPPGHTRDEARALIHATHLAPDAVR
jgi:deoxyribonuclease-2